MAKELPYFKFNAAEWISGEITLEDLTTQGAFINICAFYWFKSGLLSTSEIKRRLKLKQATIDALIQGNHIKVNSDMVEITFLREQLDERGMISRRNARNGSLGGAPIGNKNAEKNNREQPKTTNIEKNKRRIREEENYIMVESQKIFDALPAIEFYEVQMNGMQKEYGNIAWRPLVPEWFAQHIGEEFKDAMHVKNSFKKFYAAKCSARPNGKAIIERFDLTNI